MSQETILLVDDEQEVVDALARTIRHGGYRILTATSGAQALEQITQASVDLVISDIDMPGMSGLELLTKIRASHPRIVRFVLTGVASLESALVAINEGRVERYLTKPWEKEELRTAIREGLDGRSRPSSSPSMHVDMPLSPRLRETLDRLMSGACLKEIASDLGISIHTARQYVKTLYRRFEVTSRAELTAKINGLR